MKDIITPPSLKSGDKIAIVSPAGATAKENVIQAAKVLKNNGFVPVIYPHALGRVGSYSGTDQDRLSDIKSALTDKDIKAILCSRGGYGAVHLLEDLDKLDLRGNAKWIIGFSDISCLHALMTKHGIKSIHGPMTKHLAQYSGEDDDARSMMDILRGNSVTYRFKGHKFNRKGVAEGRLTGGNMAVLSGLVGTEYDIYRNGDILFIEDVSEPVYKVERMMYQLELSGVLSRISGLIVGQFTNYSEEADNESMEAMIHRMTSKYSYPVAFQAPVGHVNHNIPLIESGKIKLTVTADEVCIEQ